MASRGELAVREDRALKAEIGAQLTGAQLRFISSTDFVPKSMRGNLPAIAACVATGRALGLPDMTALRSINIIDGKAAFSAELMVQLVRERGHSITFKASGESCVVYGRRVDNDDTGEFEWTVDMAKRAGLLGKDNWKKYPESMLWARAVSQLCRMLFADCFAGATYTDEELGDGVTADELFDEAPATSEGESSLASGDAESRAPARAPGDSPSDPVEEGEFEPVDTPPGPITQEQKDRLLELVATLGDKVPNLGQQLTERIKKQYNASSYNDLTEPQMGELLGWIEGQAATVAA